MNTPAAPRPSPATSADARTGAWKWCQHLQRGGATVIEAAAAAEGTADAYAKADEAVRYLQQVADHARVARDSIPNPQGAPRDQFGWLENGVREMAAQHRDGWGLIKRELVSVGGNVAVAVADRMEKVRELDAKVITRAVVDEVAKMRMEKKT